eukprot:TRINITY_DN7978_c0_g1_i1.p1 TRINITY_DN7978_c0_g1~~TRINITY_DN7978_c0_g1_i1.p1  ORF type:complete len:153 (+),score=33.72 TRINITY_DN7978_c0_g1_i1:234-692(+)
MHFSFFSSNMQRSEVILPSETHEGPRADSIAENIERPAEYSEPVKIPAGEEAVVSTTTTAIEAAEKAADVANVTVSQQITEGVEQFAADTAAALKEGAKDIKETAKHAANAVKHALSRNKDDHEDEPASRRAKLEDDIGKTIQNDMTTAGTV